MNTNELTKIEELQIENVKLNERLDNCARQFKKMMNTIEELQHKVSELETKVNQTSTNQDSSTTSSIQEKSDSKPSNESALTSTKEEDLKPTEGKEMPSTAIVDNNAHAKEDEEMPTESKKLRYLDTMTDKPYATKQEAQKDGIDPKFLYDFKIGRCIWSYKDEDEDDTSTVQEKTPTIEENSSSGITANPNEEKPTVLQQKPSTAIVEDDANQEKEEKAVEKKHMYFKEVTTLTDEIENDLKKNYPINEWPKLFKIDWTNNTIQSKTSRDILGYGEESKELRDMIAMDSKEGKRLMKMVGVGV